MERDEVYLPPYYMNFIWPQTIIQFVQLWMSENASIHLFWQFTISFSYQLWMKFLDSFILTIEIELKCEPDYE